VKVRTQNINALIVLLLATASPLAFAAQAPMMLSVTANAGPASGGTAVTINGIVGFTGATSVTFGGAAATSVVVVSDTQITCSTPAHAAGAVNIQIVAPGGTGTLSSGFTYQAAATFASVSPTSGPTGGGNNVTITGTGFLNTTGAASVKIGATNASSYTVISDTSILAVAPAGAGAVAITVAGPGGSATSGAGAYSYAAAAAPTVATITPASGTITGGTTLYITGTNFNNSNISSVNFGGAGFPGTSLTLIDGQTISVVTPAHVSGAVNVNVINAQGTGTLTNGFTFTSANANLQVQVKVTIARRADVQWGNATTADDNSLPRANTILPYTWIVKDAEFGAANQINLGSTYTTNDPNFPHALTIANVSKTNSTINISAQCTSAYSASGLAWTGAGAATTDVFAMSASLGSGAVVGISPGPNSLTGAAGGSVLSKGFDQNLILQFAAPTSISNSNLAGQTQTIVVSLVATPN